MPRLEQLRAGLETAGLDGLLVSHLPNIRYISGFTGSSALLLVHEDGACLLTDFRYETQLETELSGDVTPRVTRDGLVPALAGLISELPAVGRIGFESERVTVRDRIEMGERCESVSWEPATDQIERLRATKDDEEIDRLRRAAKIGDEALSHVLCAALRGCTVGRLPDAPSPQSSCPRQAARRVVPLSGRSQYVSTLPVGDAQSPQQFLL